MELSEDERALYAELVVQIAIRMGSVVFDRTPPQYPALRDRFDIKGRIFEHGFVSDFEAACAVLKKLGALQPLNWDETPQEDAGGPTAYHRMKFNVTELRDRLDDALPESAPSLSEVIETFLCLTTHYDNRVSIRRDPFPVSPDFPRVFDLFARCGYVERVGEAVKWTAKTAPEIRAIYAWNEDNISREELYDAEIDEMWRTMPLRFREVFFSGGPVDVVSLSAIISRFWYEGKWQEADLDAGEERITLRGGAVGKARDLAEKFREVGG